VPDVWDTCRRCQAALPEPVPATVGAPAVPPAGCAPGYDASFTDPVRLGAPVGPAGTFGPAAYDPSGAAASADARGGWEAPVAAPARTARSPLLAILVVATVLVVGIAGWRFVQAKLNAPPAAVQAYIDGGGVTHAPAGAGYSVRLPETPSVTTASVNGGSVDVALTEADDWEAGVAVITLPQPISDAEARTMMELAASGGTGAIAGELEDTEVTTHEGRPALDVRIKPPDGHPMRARVVTAGNRIYLLAVHAVHGTGKFFEAAVASFHLSA
jgi:hypothetical protein